MSEHIADKVDGLIQVWVGVQKWRNLDKPGKYVPEPLALVFRSRAGQVEGWYVLSYQPGESVQAEVGQEPGTPLVLTAFQDGRFAGQNIGHGATIGTTRFCGKEVRPGVIEGYWSVEHDDGRSANGLIELKLEPAPVFEAIAPALP